MRTEVASVSTRALNVSLESSDSTRAKEPPTLTTGKSPPTGPLSRGERRAAGVVVAILVAAIALGTAVWVFLFAGSADPGVDKCVTVSTASSMGGGVEHACGHAAHDWCLAASSQHNAHAQVVQQQCRLAGIV